MRLLIADDHTLFRDALAAYLTHHEAGVDVSSARDLHEAIEFLSTDDAIDLVLLDLRMQGMNGLDGLQRLIKRFPSVKIALMSGMAERADVEEAMAMGAKGYLPKTLPGKMLLNAIRQILSGDIFVARDENIGEPMPSNFDGDNGSLKADVIHAALTPREHQVLGHLASGETNKQIAEALNLQVVTIKLHVRSICRKLGVTNRTQAALAAIGRAPA